MRCAPQKKRSCAGVECGKWRGVGGGKVGRGIRSKYAESRMARGEGGEKRGCGSGESGACAVHVSDACGEFGQLRL